MLNLKAAKTKRDQLLSRLIENDLGIEDGDELVSLLHIGPAKLRAALAAKGVIAKSFDKQPGSPVEKARRDQTVEELLGLSPTARRSPAKSASKAAAPGEFDPAKHDPFFKDMCVPIAKAVELPPADSPIYDNAYPGMRVLKEKPALPDTRKYDPAFPGMKVPLD